MNTEIDRHTQKANLILNNNNYKIQKTKKRLKKQ